jgi:hypothetical protein
MKIELGKMKVAAGIGNARNSPIRYTKEIQPNQSGYFSHLNLPYQRRVYQQKEMIVTSQIHRRLHTYALRAQLSIHRPPKGRKLIGFIIPNFCARVLQIESVA